MNDLLASDGTVKDTALSLSASCQRWGLSAEAVFWHQLSTLLRLEKTEEEKPGFLWTVSNCPDALNHMTVETFEVVFKTRRAVMSSGHMA